MPSEIIKVITTTNTASSAEFQVNDIINDDKNDKKHSQAAAPPVMDDDISESISDSEAPSGIEVSTSHYIPLAGELEKEKNDDEAASSSSHDESFHNNDNNVLLMNGGDGINTDGKEEHTVERWKIILILMMILNALIVLIVLYIFLYNKEYATFKQVVSQEKKERKTSRENACFVLCLWTGT